MGSLPVGRSISGEELGQHCSAESAWIALDRHVFDVTTYLKKHPGGQKFLLEHCGKEAGEVF